MHPLAQEQRKCGAGRRRRGREFEGTRFVAHAHTGRGFRLWPIWWDEKVMVGMPGQGNTKKRSELDAPGYCDYIVTSISQPCRRHWAVCRATIRNDWRQKLLMTAGKRFQVVLRELSAQDMHRAGDVGRYL